MPDGFGDDQAAVLPNPAVAAYQAAPVRGTGPSLPAPGSSLGARPGTSAPSQPGAVMCLPRLAAISGVKGRTQLPFGCAFAK